VVLADTNVLSTFAKIGQLPLLLQLFTYEGIGVVPAVYEEVQEGVSRGYEALQAVMALIQQGQLALVVPTAEEIRANARASRRVRREHRQALAGERGRRPERSAPSRTAQRRSSWLRHGTIPTGASP
jgi:hypothetical protein